MIQNQYKVLFLSTGNAARSIIAEALLNHLSHGRFQAYSAGSRPIGSVHPLALEKLSREGIPASNASSKSWDQFAAPGAPAMDFVISVSDDEEAEICPIWPGHPITAHWTVSNPALSGQVRLAMAKVFALLERRIALLACINPTSLKRLALTHYLRDVGNAET
jgi:arsenate reductase